MGEPRQDKPKRGDVIRKTARNLIIVLVGVDTAFGSAGSDSAFVRHSRALWTSLVLLLTAMVTLDLSVLAKKPQLWRLAVPHVPRPTTHLRLAPIGTMLLLAATVAISPVGNATTQYAIPGAPSGTEVSAFARVLGKDAVVPVEPELAADVFEPDAAYVIPPTVVAGSGPGPHGVGRRALGPARAQKRRGAHGPGRFTP